MLAKPIDEIFLQAEKWNTMLIFVYNDEIAA